MNTRIKTGILRFYKQHRRMPSYAEIARLLRFSSKNAAYKAVARLIADGTLERDATGRLLPRRLFGAVPLLGAVEAGFPSAAEEELVDTMSIDEWLVERPEATFLLKVSGDSMKDAGIMAGDMVLAERGRSARDGDIVIAEVDNEWTVKRLRVRGGRAHLEAANPRYTNIVPQNELSIAAVVVGVVRKY